MRKNLAICIWFLLVQISVSIAQGDPMLEQQLKGKQNLAEIMQTVKTYYNSPDTKARLGINTVNRNIKRWLRFEWYMSSRLGPNGEFVNINQKMMDATGINIRSSAAQNYSGNTASISTGSWVVVGPLNTVDGIGRADRLAFHPTDPDIVYVGTTAGGLWKTTDAGANWTNLSPDLPSGGISGIVIDPLNTNTIYILTGDGDSNIGGFVQDFGYMRLSNGVLKSTNGGTTWTKTGDLPGANYNNLVGYRLIMHPSNNNILYACTNQGIWATSNGGATWGLNIGGGRFFNMEFKPGSDNICYATNSEPDFSRSYFLRSTNSGLTWDTVNSVTPMINNPTKRVELAVAPSNPNKVYLLAGGVPGAAGNPGLNRFRGVLMSVDEGLSFTLQTNTPNILGRATTGIDTAEQSNYDLAIAVSNTNSNNLVTGAIQVWYSSNEGNNFNYRGTLHDDVHDLGYHPVGNKLWAATDGGVYSSEDHGVTWTSHFQDMNITQFYRMAVNPDDYNRLIAGAQDNAVKRKNGLTTYFDEIACCDGFGVGYDNADSAIVYTITNQAVNRSTNGGNNFTNITPLQTTASWATSLAVHTSLPNALFVGSDSIWRSTNNGTNWTPSVNILAGWFLRTCPSNGNRVYAAGGAAYNSNNGILRRSDDGGVTWPNGNILSNDLNFPVNFPKITSINVDPTNSLKVWVTFGGFTNNMKVFYCDYNINPAGNWVNMSGSLPNVPVNTIAVDNNNNAYIGTDNGVYYRGTGMNDWVPFYNNLPYVPVTDLVISEAENRIRAATFGRGIWSSELYSACETNLNITGTLEGQEFHEASNNIVATAALLTSSGTQIQMRAGNEISLQPGFTARESTSYRGLIGPCGSGGVAGLQFMEIDSTLSLPADQYLPPTGGKRSMIHVLDVGNNEVTLEVNQKQIGDTDIILTNADGKIITHKNFVSASKGRWSSSLNINGLKPGLYYVHVLLNKRVEHMQELIKEDKK